LWIGAVSPVIADLENDGIKELVVSAQGNSEGYLSTLYIFEANGEQRSKVNINYYIDPRSLPAIADIDGDSLMEIIVEGSDSLGSGQRILVFDSNGVLERSLEIEYQMSDDLFASVVLADINSDEILEIIYGGWGIEGPKLVVLDNNGNDLPGFPVTLENTLQAQTNTPAVGNLDDDSDREIVTISHKNNQPADTTNIRAFDSDGMTLWSSQVYSISSCDPVIGDVNNDGYNEVVFTSEGGVYILDRNGNFLLDRELGQNMIHSNIALGDLDGDEDLEIIFGYRVQLNAIHHDGSTIFSYTSDGVVHNPPNIGDVDGDGSLDVIFNSDDDIYALDVNGEILDGFPMIMDPIAYSSSSLGDISNNGQVDLISSSNWLWPTIEVGTIYVWDLGHIHDPSKMHWKMFQHDPQHTGCYSSEGPVSIFDEGLSMPRSILLDQNYPNPFNPNTTISYVIPRDREEQHVTIAVYNLRGQLVKTLVNERTPPGFYSITWDGRDQYRESVSSGVYLYCIQTGDFNSTRKMLLVE
jgi:hypothetical protein